MDEDDSAARRIIFLYLGASMESRETEKHPGVGGKARTHARTQLHLGVF